MISLVKDRLGEKLPSLSVGEKQGGIAAEMKDHDGFDYERHADIAALGKLMKGD